MTISESRSSVQETVPTEPNTSVARKKNSWVASGLQAHRWIGLAFAAVLYLIALSGTLAVFHPDIERWEQPLAEEYQQFDIDKTEQAFNAYLQQEGNLTSHMYLVFPSESMPRIKFANQDGGYYLQQDGSPGPLAYDDWSHLISDLHFYLHLPENIGMIFVSAMGVMLLALIISGVLAHPSILRDAFSWRSSTPRIRFTDLHNRLSVWGLPFHLMMALTGAYFGLAGLIIVVAAEAFYDGDRSAVTQQFFAKDPVVKVQPLNINIQAPLAYLQQEVSEGQLLFMTIHEADTDKRFQEYYVQVPGRLIYSENYRFDMQGNFLGRAGYSDGDMASQIVYSIYRLHFGNFSGMASKLVYLIFGLALTVVTVSGINIWLARRKQQDALNSLWIALVWGTPLALTLSAITQVLLHWPSEKLFWGALLVCLLASGFSRNPMCFRAALQCLTLLAIVALLVAYGVIYGLSALTGAGALINLGWLLFAVFLLQRLSGRERQVI